MLPVDYYYLCGFQVVEQTLAVFGGLLTKISHLLWFQAVPRSRHLLTDVLFTHVFTDVLFTYVFTDVLFTHVFTDVLFTHVFTDVLFTHVFTDVLFTDVSDTLESILDGFLL